MFREQNTSLNCAWCNFVLQGNCKASVEILVDEADGEGRSWRLMAKVGNRMNCQLRLSEGKLSAGPVMSTRMMPPPELLELENKVSNFLSNLTDIQRNGQLPVTC